MRPANYPTGVPGVGMTTVAIGGQLLGVINLQGRVFMKEAVDCPFRVAESLLTYLRQKTPILFLWIFMQKQLQKKWPLLSF